MAVSIHASFGELISYEACLKKHLIFMWHSGFFPNLIMSLKGNILCLIDKKISTMTEALRLRNEFLYKNLSYY